MFGEGIWTKVGGSLFWPALCVTANCLALINQSNIAETR